MDGGNMIVVAIAFSIGLLAGILLGGFSFAPHAIKSIRIKAVEHGYAEWVTDTAGNSTFRWIERKDESEATDGEG